MATQPVFHGDIENASAEFLKFKREFFDDPWTAIKGEYDREALKRLAGPERELAAKLIEENLATGPQFAHAAADMGLTRCAPRLVDLMEGAGDPMEISVALWHMQAISRERVFRIWWRLAEEDDFYLEESLTHACEVLRPEDAAMLIRAGAASRNLGVRISAYMALLQLEDMILTGGQYTSEVADADRRRWLEVFQSRTARVQQHKEAGGRRADVRRTAAIQLRADRAVEALRQLAGDSSQPAIDAKSTE